MGQASGAGPGSFETAAKGGALVSESEMGQDVRLTMKEPSPALDTWLPYENG